MKKRKNGRATNELREISFELGYTKWAEGSVLVKFGGTHVLCNATVENRLPPWLRRESNPHGWVTAEYALLPRSTQSRVQRESRWPKGRTMEIARLIGRSLRMAVNLEHLGQRQVIIDCDVLQADGGTRTAAITGGWVALQLALRPFIKRGDIRTPVQARQIAAVSVGMVHGEALLDLDYQEDVNADSDLNLVMTARGEIIEIQGTAEHGPLPRAELDTLIDLATAGIKDIAQLQNEALAR